MDAAAAHTELHEKMSDTQHLNTAKSLGKKMEGGYAFFFRKQHT